MELDLFAGIAVRDLAAAGHGIHPEQWEAYEDGVRKAIHLQRTIRSIVDPHRS